MNSINILKYRWKMNNIIELAVSQKTIMVLAIVILITVTAIVRFKNIDKNVNYKNSDATWHVLLTMKAYNETPISVHKFLPIVSLGEKEDKGINWGFTIPDEEGNYYYTSFSPAGFIFPYLFIKLFHLPFTETSLYLFNTLLLILSGIILGILLYDVLEGNIFVILIGEFLYVVCPEIMHGMGIVYWHQSIMQFTLLLQILAYHRYINKSKKCSYLVFLVMCIINPYIEWTGYIANIGFALSELLRNYKKQKIYSLRNFMFVCSMMLISGALFCIHYLLVVDWNTFIYALEIRFFARNITVDRAVSEVLKGYIESFWPVLVSIVLGIIILIFLNKVFSQSQKQKNANSKWLYFVMFFPILENFIMKEHAITYSYDRMKLIFILIFVFCDIWNQILKKCKRMFPKFLIFIVMLTIGVSSTALNK